jgi:hypothetical protein
MPANTPSVRSGCSPGSVAEPQKYSVFVCGRIVVSVAGIAGVALTIEVGVGLIGVRQGRASCRQDHLPSPSLSYISW